jgi:acetyl esterase/lipase
MRRFRFLVVTAIVAAVIASLGPPVYTIANVAALSGDFERRVDIPFGTKPRQKLDVYVPSGAQHRPIIVYWFGGAWRFGSKSRYRFVGAALANAGYVAVLPDYRLYPEAKFPDFIDDGADALAWVVGHAEEIGSDPRRIYVAGHSSGAHLAAMLAYDDKQLARVGLPRDTIRGLIGLSGPYALKPDLDDPHLIFAAPYGLADWQPMLLVQPGAPAALLIHGDADEASYVGHARGMAERLESVGVRVTLRISPGRDHNDTVLALARTMPDRLPVLAEIRRFIGE